MLGLCDRFRCLPSQVYAEDAEILRLIRIEALGRPDPPQQEGGEG